KFSMKRLTILLAFILGSIETYSCTCEMYNIEYYADKVPYIFTGEVIELVDSTDWTNGSILTYEQGKQIFKNKGYNVNVKVIDPIKKSVSAYQIIEFKSEDFSNCDPLYEKGKTYLFFADAEGKAFKMRQCTYWGELKNSEKYIEPLRKALSKKR